MAIPSFSKKKREGNPTEQKILLNVQNTSN